MKTPSTQTRTMLKAEILLELKQASRSVVLKTGEDFTDLRQHTAAGFDDQPYAVLETPHELIVINHRKVRTPQLTLV